MAKKKVKPPGPEAGGGDERMNLYFDPGEMARVERQAARKGLRRTAYAKQAIMIRLEDDERTDPGVTRPAGP